MPQYFTLSMPFKPSNELQHDIEQGFKLLTIRYNTELKKLKKRYDYLIKTQEYENNRSQPDIRLCVQIPYGG